jgi:hypothetical protein
MQGAGIIVLWACRASSALCNAHHHQHCVLTSALCFRAPQADALDNIWVPILVTTGVNETEARATELMKIAAGTNSATSEAQITTP